MSHALAKELTAFLSVHELAQVTGGQDPIPVDPPPTFGDADDLANG